MAIVFTDSFTVGADVDISAYPSAGDPDYFYTLGSGITVTDATDRAEHDGAGRVIARVIDASVPSSDQEISVSMSYGSALEDIAFICARCRTDDSDNCYLGIVFTGSGNEVELYRRTPGTSTLIASRDNGITGSGTVTAVLRATGTNPVSLTYTVDGGTALTFDDSNASRHQTGTPGIGMRENGAWVDNVSVDDLVSDASGEANASGTGAANSAGAALSAATANSSGAGSAAATGAATVAATYSAAGDGAAEAVGEAQASGVGDAFAAGETPATAVGTSTAATAYSAEGAATAAAESGETEAEEAAPSIPDGQGGAWGRNRIDKKKRKREIENEDRELIALIQRMAPDIMRHRRTLH